MIYNLRPYQQNTVNQISNSFFDRGNESAILCIPTGGGKTVVFSHIARSCIDKGFKVMIACDRKELIQQSYDKLVDYGLFPSIIAPGQSQIVNTCYVSSVDTLIRRKRYPDVDLLIIDEAHKTKFDKLAHHYKGNGKTHTIGATATPFRWGSQESLHKVYQDIVNPVNVSDLIGEGYLSPCVTYGPDVDLSKIKSGQDYDKGELFSFYNKQQRYTGVIHHYKEFCHNEGPTIVFNVNREHSRNMAEEFKSYGYKAIHVDGSFSDFERRRIMNGFKNGEYDIVCNCSILTTGYDNPRVRNVIMNRATKSLPLFLQIPGRGSRILPEEGKTHFNFIDMGSNIQQHGFWEDDRTWDLVKKPKSKQAAPAPIKECDQCEAIVHASKPVCNHCGYVFPKKTIILPEAEFKQIVKKDVPGHLKKPFDKMSRDELEEYRQLKGYKPGWVHIQLELRKKKKIRPNRKLVLK